MGVKWLTSFVKNVERAVSSTREFECREEEVEEAQSRIGNGDEPKPHFVVDAWAFIFHVWLNEFGDSIRALNLDQYQEVVRNTIRVWNKAGIDVTFVFDGPFLPTKIDTLVRRRADVVAGTFTFMRSSAQSRTSARFQASCGIIPPSLHPATVEAVRSVQETSPQGAVQLVFAPTEADSLVAELATQHKEGYALSQDSDFFILCSRGQGCAGYVPLDSLEFIVKPPASTEADLTVPVDDSDDGFQVVSSKKKRKGAQQSSGASDTASTAQQSLAFPPDLDKIRSVRVQAYKAHDLAAYLQIPPTLLPLLAAIVGNDYITALQSRVLLNHLSVPQRIPMVAERLRVEWLRMKNEAKSQANASARRALAYDNEDARSEMGSSATATPTRATPGALARSVAATIVPNDPVRTMVDAIVKKLLSQAEAAQGPSRHLSTGEHESIVDSIIDSAATYSLLTHSNAPHLASPSATFFGDAIALLAGRTADRIAQPEALKKYRAAYETGHFREGLIEIVSQRILLTRGGPEDPDVASVQTDAARRIRLWLYAVLFEVWGMSWARETWEDPTETDQHSTDGSQSSEGGAAISFYPDRTYKEGEKPDDVISVDTESSASEIGEEDEDSLPSRPGSALDMHQDLTKPAPGVTEYVRAGTSYSPQLVRIVPLMDMLKGDVENSNAEIPSSLSGLLAEHEASREPGEVNAPKSDPVPRPVALQPLSTRLDYFLYALGSFTTSIRALPVHLWLPAASLRALLQAETRRLSPNRLRYNWSPKEISVAVTSMIPIDTGKDDVAADAELVAKRRTYVTDLQSQSTAVFPSTRSIHFATQVQLVLDAATMLAQSLLLPVDERRWSTPHRCFNGVLFHHGMYRIHSGESGEPKCSDDDELYGGQLATNFQRAVVQGFDDKLGIDEADLRQERKAQKAKKREQKTKAAVNNASASPSAITAARTETNMDRREKEAGRNAFAALLES